MEVDASITLPLYSIRQRDLLVWADSLANMHEKLFVRFLLKDEKHIPTYYDSANKGGLDKKQDVYVIA